MACAPSQDRSAWASAQSDQSSLCGQWVAKDPSFLHEDSEDSDQDWADAQADLSLRWAHMPFCGFVMPWLFIKQLGPRLQLDKTSVSKMI